MKYKEYFMGNEEKWYENLEKVKEFMGSNNKRPSRSCKNEDGKMIAEWINTQLNNYKENKCIMKDETIKKAWEEFINNPKYVEYFNHKARLFRRYSPSLWGNSRYI